MGNTLGIAYILGLAALLANRFARGGFTSGTDLTFLVLNGEIIAVCVLAGVLAFIGSRRMFANDEARSKAVGAWIVSILIAAVASVMVAVVGCFASVTSLAAVFVGFLMFAGWILG